MSSIFHYPVYLGARLVWLVVNLLPARRAYGFGASVGRFAFRFSGSRKKIAIDNILKAGITTDPDEAARLAKASMAHFVGHILEGLKVPVFMTPEHAAENITEEMPDVTRALIEDPQRPVLLLTPHLGCWEVGLSLIASYKRVLVLASTFGNPWIQRFSESHFRSGVEVYPKKRGFSGDLIRRWGEGRAFVLAVDQHAGKHGIWLDFFGRPACTHTSPARLFLSTGYPVVVGAFLRTGTLRYHVVASEPINVALTGDRERDTVAILNEVNRQFEAVIRRYPEQYLWAHRRWRNKPAVVQRRF